MVFGRTGKKLSDEDIEDYLEIIGELKEEGVGDPEKLDEIKELLENKDQLSGTQWDYLKEKDDELTKQQRPLLTTSHTIEGQKITDYLGIVSGHNVLGMNIFSDWMAGIRDIIGGRSASYEKYFIDAREEAIDEMSYQAEKLDATAIISIKIEYTTIEAKNTRMLMVSANGTAVKAIPT